MQAINRSSERKSQTEESSAAIINHELFSGMGGVLNQSLKTPSSHILYSLPLCTKIQNQKDETISIDLKQLMILFAIN